MDQAAVAAPPLRSRLWIRLLIAYFIPTAAVGAGIGLLAYQASRNTMENQLGEALVSVARTAALQVGRQRAVALQPGEEHSRTHKNLTEKLTHLQQATRVERIVLFDRRERALLDSRATYAIGEPIAALAANRTELAQVFSGHDRASMLFSGRDGALFKSGFAPVRIDGRVVAAVGVDGSAAFFGPLSQLGRTLALVGGFALVLVVLLTLVVSRRITRPLDRLAHAARNIGSGDLESEIKVETTDELGVLAETLNEMRESILARDRQLQMMLSGIAHEVRNPLGGMTLFVGLLAEELSDPDALKKVERISRELHYLSQVVNDFLDFARNKPPELNEVDPRLELEQVRSLCQAQADERGVDLVVRIDEAITSARWDQESLRRALLNLVRNGLQACSAGTRVELRATALDGGGITLEVEDQGDGIPTDKAKKIFDPFFTTRQKGTGLGLSLVKKTVESHGGTVAFTTQAGRGTVFTIELPDHQG
jgi:signal transduction histidine kinase